MTGTEIATVIAAEIETATAEIATTAEIAEIETGIVGIAIAVMEVSAEEPRDGIPTMVAASVACRPEAKVPLNDLIALLLISFVESIKAWQWKRLINLTCTMA